MRALSLDRRRSRALKSDRRRSRALKEHRDLALPALPLLAWFSRSRRDLPWRTRPGEPRDPYKTWLSEVMLQQTRVETMVPYYLRFLARFPTLAALANAPLDDVLALWSGLGYYARARNLHRAAQEALLRHGQLPRTSTELRELPGFGPYTSAAVASLAFGEQVALVDGNVARVLARLFGIEGDIDRAKERSWELAPRLLPRGQAGVFNEALMELGAMICTPRSPRCESCPLARDCVARKRGNAEETPAPRAKKTRPLLIRAALRLDRTTDRHFLLQRQPEGSLFAGLWDLPALEVANTIGIDTSINALQSHTNALQQAAQSLARSLGMKGRLDHIARVEQTLTHREMRVEIFVGKAPQKDPTRSRADLRWAAPGKDDLAQLGLSSLARKSIAASGRSQHSAPA